MKKFSGIHLVLKAVLAKSRCLCSGIVCSVIVSIIAGLIPPLVLERIIDHLTGNSTVSMDLVVLYFLIMVISGLFDALREILITVFGQRVTKEFRHEMCGKLSRLPASYYSDNESGVIASRFVNDVDTVDTLFASGIISMFVDGCRVISILAVIFVKSSGLGILMLLITPLLYVYTRYVQRRMFSVQLNNREAVGRANNHIPETIENIRMIHVFRKEKYMENKYDSYIQSGYKAMEKSNLYDAVYSPIILVISSIVISVMMVLSSMGGLMQNFFGMSVGTSVAIIAYVGKVFDPLESIGMEIQSIQSAIAGVHRINEFLNEPEMIKEDTSYNMSDITLTQNLAVEFKNVSFGYTNNQKILNNFNVQVNIGDNVTLTGRTGVGKSTIIKLILGLISPDIGEISVFGVRACCIPNHEKRKLFGYVEQNFRMIPGTVFEQISLFDPEITRSDVEQAVRLVGLHDKVMQFSSGYETECEKSLFSQGQWQLLAIARAVAAKPVILLLDEITANLDSKTEQQVMDALKRASEDRTVISISHRMYEYHGGNIIKI